MKFHDLSFDKVSIEIVCFPMKEQGQISYQFYLIKASAKMNQVWVKNIFERILWNNALNI